MVRITIAGLLLGACLPGVSWAQNTDSTPNLEARVAAMQVQADGVSRQATALITRTGGVQVAQLFGESDEEKAARLQREQAQDSSISTLNQRVGDLDETLRRLTGQVEELDHRISELGERMGRMRKDFDYKVCALAAQELGATTEPGGEMALPCSGQNTQSGTAPVSSAPQGGGSNEIHLAPPPGVLGTLPRNEMGNLPRASETAPNQMASLDTRPQFDTALSMLAKAQYDEASAAFRTFADSYPRDDLAPQAVYWIGDIALVQKDYPDAARAFAEELKKYPNSTRAPDSMLKLGQSLIAMNAKKEGCRALGTLPSEYPAAPKSLTDQALAVRKAAGCR